MSATSAQPPKLATTRSLKPSAPAPAQNPRKPLTKEMLEAIRRSGYLLEQRLVPVIERFGYSAIPNERFLDPESGEVRELDIYAMSAMPIAPEFRDFVFPVLLIACKNLTCPIVLFTQNEPKVDDFLGHVQLSGLPQEIVEDEKHLIKISRFLKLEKFHHYYRTGHVASQFCAVYETKKAGVISFEAGHTIGGRIELFKDFDTLRKAVESDKRAHGNWFYVDGSRERVNLQVYYPIFLTSGPLVECRVTKHGARYRRVHRVGFLYRSYHNTSDPGVRIDVVDEIGLRSLLRTIEREQYQMTERLRAHKQTVTRSLEFITKKLRKWAPQRRKAYVAGMK